MPNHAQFEHSMTYLAGLSVQQVSQMEISERLVPQHETAVRVNTALMSVENH
jgi:hypothetical protein